MDQIWERYDLACTEPEGCEVLDYVLRTIVWSFIGLAVLVFFIAIRAWTRNLHPLAGTALALAIAAVIVRLGRNYVGSTGNLRNAVILLGLGILAAWVGRPAFTERDRKSVAAPVDSPVDAPVNAPVDAPVDAPVHARVDPPVVANPEIIEESSPPSATH